MAMYTKAVFDLYRPLDEKVPEERNIYVLMSVHPLFVDPPVPYADFLAALDAQDAAIAAAENGGRAEIATRRARSLIVDDMVRSYRSVVTVKANGDKEIILSTGFKHTKDREPAGTMPKVAGVKKMPSDVSGTLKLRWNPVKHVSFFEVSYRVVPTTDPDTAPWEKETTKPSNIELSGLTTLKYYEVKVRAKGPKGWGGYSDVLTILVV